MVVMMISHPEVDNEGFISIMNPQRLLDEQLTEEKQVPRLPRINNGRVENEPVR